jgi:hypothetical protein
VCTQNFRWENFIKKNSHSEGRERTNVFGIKFLLENMLYRQDMFGTGSEMCPTEDIIRGSETESSKTKFI